MYDNSTDVLVIYLLKVCHQNISLNLTRTKIPLAGETDYPDEDSISEGDRVFIKQEETTFEESTHFSHLQLTIPVTMAMSPEAQLLVYHIRPQDGEIVADAITFKVKRCFQNKVRKYNI